MTTMTYTEPLSTSFISSINRAGSLNSVMSGDARHILRIKDPGSALTHFVGAIASVVAAPFLIQHAITMGVSTPVLIGLCIYAFSLILLYSASTTYHSVLVSKESDKIFKKIDHMSIFVLIAGTYTPLCLTVLADTCGIPLLIGVWAVALSGICFKFFWVTCPKWVSSVMYIGMGWLCVLAFPWLLPALTPFGFWMLLLGGISYTVGGVIYALKLPVFDRIHPNFGAHEIFHVFVMIGSLLHFIMVYNCLC